MKKKSEYVCIFKLAFALFDEKGMPGSQLQRVTPGGREGIQLKTLIDYMLPGETETDSSYSLTPIGRGCASWTPCRCPSMTLIG
jgi:hypothetical protein